MAPPRSSGTDVSRVAVARARNDRPRACLGVAESVWTPKPLGSIGRCPASIEISSRVRRSPPTIVIAKPRDESANSNSTPSPASARA